MGQETHHKQSASFGTNFDKPFPDEAINCTTPHFGGRVLSLLWGWANRKQSAEVDQ